MSFFSLQGQSGAARAGVFHTAHGPVETPIFMPVGTRATVKALWQEELEEVGASIILGNTYHLYLRPGHQLIERLGGLHSFMSWPRPLLTDSGGFQVFSLAALNQVSEEGVLFQSHLDGSRHLMSPELSMEIQRALGSDIVMAFDECPALPATPERLRESMELTLRWAQRCQACALGPHQKLFGIIQGGLDLALRRECLERLEEMDFPGLAIGGLSVGEKNAQMLELLADFAPRMPAHKPRYLMGVGKPTDIIQAIERGVDMFDCVLPTRNARNGQALTWQGPLNIKRRQFAEDTRPLDERCDCRVCRRYTRAYLRHLTTTGEYLAGQMISHHNIYFLLQLTRRARQSILQGVFDEFAAQFYKDYAFGHPPGDDQCLLQE